MIIPPFPERSSFSVRSHHVQAISKPTTIGVRWASPGLRGRYDAAADLHNRGQRDGAVPRSFQMIAGARGSKRAGIRLDEGGGACLC